MPQLRLGANVRTHDAFMTQAGTLTVDGTLDAAGAEGFVDVNGGTIAGATANLLETGAAPGTITGYYALGSQGTVITGTLGGAVLRWGSGAIVQIGDGSGTNEAATGGAFFSVAGPNTFAEIGDTHSNSALTSLATIASNGGLDVSFGATVALSGSLTVAQGGQLYLDGLDGGAGGGSSLTINGDLVDESPLFGNGVEVGSPPANLATTLTVTGSLDNDNGLFVVVGGTTVSAVAEALIGGAAPTTLVGGYSVGAAEENHAGQFDFLPNAGASVLQWGSGGITAIGDGASESALLLIAGANAFLEVGDTNSNSALDHLATIASNGGLEVGSGVTIDTTAALTIQSGGALGIDDAIFGGANQFTVGGDLINQSGLNEFRSFGILVGNTSITSNDTLTVDGVLQNAADGLLTLTGASSTALAIADVDNGATNAGDIAINADGLLDLTGGAYTQSGGTTTVGGTLTAGSATLSAGELSLLGGTVVAALNIGNGVAASGFGLLDGAVSNAGSVQAQGGTLIVEDGVSGAGAFSVGANAVMDFGGSVASGQIVTFNGAAATIVLGDATGFAGTIAAFSAGSGDIIDLHSLDFVAGATASISNGILSVISGGTTDMLAVSGLANGTKFATSQETGGTGTAVEVRCFAAGTLIQTSLGCIPVEALSEGAFVLTASGEPHRVVWVGHRHVACHRHRRPDTLWPARVRAGAFGPSLPRRDLWLSQDHAVFVDGVLIPIRHLLNGDSIRIEPCDEITYFHVELEHHDVLLAEGLPVESYLDTGDRANFDNSGVVRLFPDFSPPEGAPLVVWEAEGCAPLVVTGPRLRAARRRVNALLPGRAVVRTGEGAGLRHEPQPGALP